MNKIQFNYLAPVPELREKKRLKKFLESIVAKEKKKLMSVKYIFCSDSFLLNINTEFLGHDEFTDIISFELNRPGEPIEGEIYISINRVRENAADFNLSVGAELHRVIFHGLLHFCGFKDKLKKDQKTMRSKEDFYLDRYNH